MKWTYGDRRAVWSTWLPINKCVNWKRVGLIWIQDDTLNKGPFYHSLICSVAWEPLKRVQAIKTNFKIIKVSLIGPFHYEFTEKKFSMMQKKFLKEHETLLLWVPLQNHTWKIKLKIILIY